MKIINLIGIMGFDYDVSSIIDQAENEKEELHFIIHSAGGSFSQSLAIFNYLKNHEATITVENIGLCASAAMLVFLAGNRVIIHPESVFMLHRTTACECGNAKKFQQTADYLKKYDDLLISILDKNSPLSVQEIKNAIDNAPDGELWLYGEEIMSIFNLGEKAARGKETPSGEPETAENVKNQAKSQPEEAEQTENQAENQKPNAVHQERERVACILNISNSCGVDATEAILKGVSVIDFAKNLKVNKNKNNSQPGCNIAAPMANNEPAAESEWADQVMNSYLAKKKGARNGSRS